MVDDLRMEDQVTVLHCDECGENYVDECACPDASENHGDGRTPTGASASIDYVYTIPGSAWVVQGTDKVLGEGWVLLHRQGTNGAMWYDRRIERADTIRRHRDGQ